MFVSERRKVFGEKFVDLGNYTVVALIFGQLLTEKKSILILIIGAVLFAFFWVIGFLLLQKERRKR